VRVRWLRRALANLGEEAQYIAVDNPPAARTVTTIFAAVDRLARHPAMGRSGRVPGTRELVVSGTPYVIPYRVRGGVLEVLRAFHAARQWPSEFKK